MIFFIPPPPLYCSALNAKYISFFCIWCSSGLCIVVHCHEKYAFTLHYSALHCNAAIWFLHLLLPLTHWSGFFWCTHSGESLPLRWFLQRMVIIGECLGMLKSIFLLFSGIFSDWIVLAAVNHCHCADFYSARQLSECSKVFFYFLFFAFVGIEFRICMDVIVLAAVNHWHCTDFYSGW